MVVAHDREQVADTQPAVRVVGMQRMVRHHRVGVAPPDPAADDVAAVGELLDDRLYRPLAETGPLGDVRDAGVGVQRDPEQHLGGTGEELHAVTPTVAASSARTAAAPATSDSSLP